MKDEVLQISNIGHSKFLKKKISSNKIEKYSKENIICFHCDFQCDTGADIEIISPHYWKYLGKSVIIHCNYCA